MLLWASKSVISLIRTQCLYIIRVRDSYVVVAPFQYTGASWEMKWRLERSARSTPTLPPLVQSHLSARQCHGALLHRTQRAPTAQLFSAASKKGSRRAEKKSRWSKSEWLPLSVRKQTHAHTNRTFIYFISLILMWAADVGWYSGRLVMNDCQVAERASERKRKRQGCDAPRGWLYARKHVHISGKQPAEHRFESNCTHIYIFTGVRSVWERRATLNMQFFTAASTCVVK